MKKTGVKKKPAGLKKAPGKPAKPDKPKKSGFDPEVKVCPDAGNLFEEAAHLFMETALEAVRKRGRFVIALSGGSTPKSLFQQLSETPYNSLVPWAKTYVFWVDERHVSLNDEASNYRLAREQLLSKVPVPKDHVFPMLLRSSVQEASNLYERGLKHFFGSKGLPRFDFTLLGMGEDGHTASLFPGTPQLNELEKWVVGYYVDETRKERISLTFPVLNASRLAVVLLEGEKKAHRLKDVLEGSATPPRYPIQYLRPTDGRLLFMMDPSAASQLKSK